jgi:hypothetical protein
MYTAGCSPARAPAPQRRRRTASSPSSCSACGLLSVDSSTWSPSPAAQCSAHARACAVARHHQPAAASCKILPCARWRAMATRVLVALSQAPHHTPHATRHTPHATRHTPHASRLASSPIYSTQVLQKRAARRAPNAPDPPSAHTATTRLPCVGPGSMGPRVARTRAATRKGAKPPFGANSLARLHTGHYPHDGATWDPARFASLVFNLRTQR